MVTKYGQFSTIQQYAHIGFLDIFPGTVGVWAFATQKYGLVSQHGNMQIAIK